MDSGGRREFTRRSVLGWAMGSAALAVPFGSALGSSGTAFAAGRPTDPGSYISFTPAPGCFPLVRSGHAVPLVVSDRDWPGVVRVVGDLQADIERVTGARPVVSRDTVPAQPEITISS